MSLMTALFALVPAIAARLKPDRDEVIEKLKGELKLARAVHAAITANVEALMAERDQLLERAYRLDAHASSCYHSGFQAGVHAGSTSQAPRPNALAAMEAQRVAGLDLLAAEAIAQLDQASAELDRRIAANRAFLRHPPMMHDLSGMAGLLSHAFDCNCVPARHDMLAPRSPGAWERP